MSVASAAAMAAEERFAPVSIPESAIAAAAQVGHTHGDEPVPATEFQQAIDTHHVRFDQLVRCYHGQNCPLVRLEYKQKYGEFYSSLLSEFENKHGSIVDFYPFNTGTAAIAVTSNDEFFVISPGISELNYEATEFLDECERLADTASGLLKGHARTQVVSDVFNVATHLASGFLEDKSGQEIVTKKKPEGFAVLKRELAHIQEYFEKSAQRDAQLDYFMGMLGGLGLILVAVASLWFALLPRLLTSPPPFTMLVCLFAGAMGAMVSVMTRMTSGDLKLRFDTGSRYIRILGMVRPMIGAIVATVIYVLIVAGLLPLTTPATSEQVDFFFGGIAFLSGFSERWAQDMLTNVESRITTTVSTTKTETGEEGKTVTTKTETTSTG